MSTREPKPTKTPDWLIERLAAGDLDPLAEASLRRRLTEEGRSPEAETARLAASNRELLEAAPPATVAAEVRRRADSQCRTEAAQRRPRRTLVWGGALVAAGALALVLLPRPTPGPRGPVDDGLEPTHIKGPPRLLVYRHGPAGDHLVREGDAAARGDLFQLAYLATNHGFGVMLSIDGAGQVTQHWPEPGSARTAAPLKQGGEFRLPSSYELDDAPGFERFFLVAADQPFDVAPVLQAARALGAQPSAARRMVLPLPSTFHQMSLALDKPRRGP